MLTTGAISPEVHVWWEGQATWVPLRQSPFFATPLPPPAVPPVPVGMPVPPHITPMGPTSRLAIWSLVCACLSFFCCVFTSIPAIILGHMGLGEIKRNPALQGRGMALAGLVLGYVFTALIILYAIMVLTLQALGSQMRQVFQTINVQVQNSSTADQTNSASDTNSAPSTSSDSSTNSADSTTNAPPSTSPTPATNSPQDSPSPANE